MIGENNVISTYRLEISGNKETYSATATLENQDCYIEHIDQAIAVMLDSKHAAETYKLWIDGEPDIKINDKVTDQNSNEYKVSGVQRFKDNSDIDNHSEILMYKTFTT